MSVSFFFFFYIIFIIHACKYLFQYYICYKTLFFSVEIYLTDIWPRFLPPFSVFVKNPYGYIWISFIYMSGLVVSKSYNNRHMRISKTDSGESSKCIVLMVLQKKIEKSFFFNKLLFPIGFLKYFLLVWSATVSILDLVLGCPIENRSTLLLRITKKKISRIS